MNQRQRAFTLLEILIALMIVSVGLYAVISAASNSTYQRLYLRDKTIATWIARDVIKQAQFKLITFGAYKKKLTGETTMLGETYQWTLEREKTADVQLILLKVNVSLNGNWLVDLTGYMGGTRA